MDRSDESSKARVTLFGASPSTGNLGLNALFEATVAQLADRLPGLEFTVFDHEWGTRRGAVRAGDRVQGVELRGAHHTKRIWRRDSLWNMKWSGRLGGLGNAYWGAIRDSRLVLDLSAGDSFTDLYGAKRFSSVVLPKELALETRRPLVLLPQTYGPFVDPALRERAAAATAGASRAWARDGWSYDRLRELLGDRFDPARHRRSVDVAFGLLACAPPVPLDSEVEDWLTDGGGPVVGVNVSGLILNRPAEAARRFSFTANYAEALGGLVKGLLEHREVRVVLVPHVLAASGSWESDPDANQTILAELPAASRGRVRAVAPPFTASAIKHLISRMDWFCGTRMHSTIAALSSGVPTAAVAYSPKFAGVFDACGVADHVHDPRKLETRELLRRLLDSFDGRSAAKEALARRLPEVHAELRATFDAVARLVTTERLP